MEAALPRVRVRRRRPRGPRELFALAMLSSSLLVLFANTVLWYRWHAPISAVAIFLAGVMVGWWGREYIRLRGK